MGPFTVTKEVIAGLADEALRALLGKLLESEAIRRGIPASCIAAGGNQTAGDGGVDASISWTGSPKAADWLPCRHIVFQCKAETMAAAKLKREMRPKGAARPLFYDLVNRRGAYIVFSTDDVSNSGYQNRRVAMAEALSDVPGSACIHLDFFGADRIARWVNQHAGITLDVLEVAGRSVRGWRPHGGWSTANHASTVYLYDESSRANVGGNDVSSVAAITAIRRQLRTAGAAVRLIGISGMGKTRLAEALFDLALDPETAIPSSRAIYGDAGTELGVGSALLAEQLVASGVEAVIVVDNCTAHLHKQLNQIVRRKGSKSSLLTIDYDVGDDQASDTLIVSLGANSNELLASLLKKRNPKLSSADRHHVAEFAGGNARIALKIAEGAQEGVSLAKLNDTELLGRLFQTGRQDRDVFARRCAEAASLVYAFYIEDGDECEMEYQILAQIAGVSAEEFFRQIAIFLNWGIIQQRGPQRAVMPPPIANMLAGETLKRVENGNLAKIFEEGPPRLFTSFARRLGFLHHSPEAVALAEMFFADGQRLGQPHELGKSDLKTFLNLAPAAPGAALAAIERTLASLNAYTFVALDRSGRREFAELFAHMAHEPPMFVRAMDALLAFVIAEPLPVTNNSVLKYFLERFWVVLSATKANFQTRSEYIDRLLDDDDERVCRIGVEALDHMINVRQFSSSIETRFGARPRGHEWQPDANEQTHWFEFGLARLVQIALSDAPEAGRASKIVARHVRDHVLAGYADLTIAAVQKIANGRYWDDGWIAISETLSFDRVDFGDELSLKMFALEAKLRPFKLDDLFDAFVIGEPWKRCRPRGLGTCFNRNSAKLAYALGRCLARNNLVTRNQVERAFEIKGQSGVRVFGEGLARATNDVPRQWTELLALYRSRAEDSRNPTLLAGFLDGVAQRDCAWVDDQLDAMIDDDAFRRDIAFMHPSMALGGRAMNRFSKALASGVVAAPSFQWLKFGGITKSIPVDDLSAFLAKLYVAKDGVQAAVEVLHMRIYGDQSDGRIVEPELVSLGQTFLSNPRTYEEDHARLDYAITCIAKFALAEKNGRDIAVEICRAIRNSQQSDSRYFHEFGKVCALVREEFLRVVFDEIVMHPDASVNLEKHFFKSSTRDGEDGRNAIAIDADIALEWVGEDPSCRAPRLASLITYSVEDAATRVQQWSPLARSLIDTTADPIAVLNVFQRRFFSSGSSSGSFSSRFVRRKPLLAALAGHSNRSIRNWVRQAQRQLEDSIRQWDAQDRSRESRFE